MNFMTHSTNVLLEVRLADALPQEGSLVLPAIQRLDPTDSDEFRSHFSDFGSYLIWWFDQERRAREAASRSSQGTSAQDVASWYGAYEKSWARSWLDLEPETLEPETITKSVEENLEQIRRRLERAWQEIFHPYVRLVEDLFSLLETSSLKWRLGGLPLVGVDIERTSTGHNRLVGTIVNPFLRARLEALSACGSNGPGLRICEYCGLFFIPTRSGDRYGRYCPGFTCADLAYEQRYSKTEYRQEYVARWKRLNRLRKRTNVKESDKRRAEREFEEWKRTNSPRSVGRADG
jgi:hypothetical protein